MAAGRPALLRGLARNERSATAFCLLATALAVGIAGTLGTGGPDTGPPVLRAAALIVTAAVNTEVGRWLEGRRHVEQRPHKALSAWALAAAVLLPPQWVLVVVALTYAHVWWRGVRPPLRKWVGSAAFVVLAGFAAAGVTSTGQAPDETAGTVLTLGLAIGVFLVVESALFWAVSWLGDPEDEAWLRATLSDPGFYATELLMLSVGALTVLLWTAQPTALLFLVPVFVVMQQAALHAPLRAQARLDDKTGLLRYEAWRWAALAQLERARREELPWAVAILDLDHFKAYNDAHGHLAGDRALAAVAEALRRHTGAQDLLGRFGGEEFVLLMTGASGPAAPQTLERMRSDVAGLALCRSITISSGLVSGAGRSSVLELTELLVQADRALYDAKGTGRDRVVHRDQGHDPEPALA